MMKPDPELEPDWDDDNIEHIAKHGLKLEQVEELYYGEGPYPTLAITSKKKIGRRSEYRYRLWGTDAYCFCMEAIIAPFPEFRIWRCVTALSMTPSTQRIYFRRLKK
jgi:uncharacterized DUF497 family protein